MDRLTVKNRHGVTCPISILNEVISRLSAYEDTGLTPGQINTLLKIAKAIIHDSEPWEGDKQFCHVGHLRRLFSTIEHNS